MAINEIHLNDIGTKFEVTVLDGTTAVDLGGITVCNFIFQRPDRTTVTKAGTVEDEANGIISYTTLSGDLNQAGRWKLQVSITIPGWSGRSDIGEFVVHPNL